MAVNSNVTELDFDQIKNGLKTYLSSQSKYNDYDFEGSGMSVLLDILAYNTHYNAMIAHLALNEAFLDSAQIRGNVVSHAKLLGYTPRSTSAASATINIVVNNPIGTPIPITLTLNRGTKLTSIIDGKEFGFIVIESRLAVYNSSTNTFTFENVIIKQGTFKSLNYRFDKYNLNQKFVIPDEYIDTTTLRVRIRENDNSTSHTMYTLFGSLVDIGSASKVYFLQENSNGKYEIYFGDGVIGYTPQTDNIVELEYVYTSEDIANGARTFAFSGDIEGNSDITINTASKSAGGAERENIESIRFNSPLTYITQNRAVTADDYRAIILREYADIEAISVWGGEDSNPPDYGKVYVSIKPKTGDVLDDTQKSYIIQNILSGKNVVSITPVIVDPEYTYIKLETFFKYNPNLTDLTKAELESSVRNIISTYNNNYLKSFDGVFRYSNLLGNIDSSTPAILNSYTRVYMFKTVYPSNSSFNSYDMYYSSPIFTTSTDTYVINSTPFLMNGAYHWFGDEPIVGTNERNIFIYKLVNNTLTVVVAFAGTIYTVTGRLVINNFRPDTTDPITFTALPNSNDLAPKRNQLLSISMADVSVTGEIDIIAVAGASGTVNYTTTSRIK